MIAGGRIAAVTAGTGRRRKANAAGEMMTKSPKTEIPASGADAEDTASALTRMADEAGAHGRSLAEIRRTLDSLAGTAGTMSQELTTLRAQLRDGAANAVVEGQLRKVAERIEDHVRVCVADFHRWQETARLATGRLALAVAVVAPPVLFALGVLAEQRWELLPMHDPTGGWKDYVWQRFGGELVDCTRKAQMRGGGAACAIATSVE